MTVSEERDLYIPHLGYSVYLRDAYNAPPDVQNRLRSYVAVSERYSPHSLIIWVSLPLYDEDMPMFGHEIVHALEYIAEDYGIDFKKEKEHLAYLFQYIQTELVD